MLLYIVLCAVYLGSACSEQDFENFIDGAVALLDYSNTDCSLYDKVVVY